MSRTGSILFGLTILFGLGLGVCLVTVEKLKNLAVTQYNAGIPVSVFGLLSTLSVADYCLLALCLGVFAWLGWCEFRNRAISAMLASLRPMQAVLLVGLVMVWTGQAYLYPGVLLGGDTGGHITRFDEFGQAIGAGAFPHWTNHQYLGSPLFGFTGPLTYMVGGALRAVISDSLFTAKLFLFVTHVVAGWVFYLLARRLDFAPLPAAVSAIGFGGSFAILHLFLFRGVFPQALTVIFMIMLYYAAEGLMRGLPHRAREMLIFTVATAGLILNHQPHALFIALYLAIFGAMCVLLGRWRLNGLPYLLAAGIAGVVVSLPAVVPIIVEADWVMIEPSSGFFGLHLPTGERIANLLTWSNTRTNWGRDYWAYLGWGSAGLGLLGAFAAFARRLTDAHRLLALAMLPGFVLMFFLHNAVVRDVMFIQFYLGIFAAMGMGFLAQKAMSSPSRIVLLAVSLVIADVALTGIQPVTRSDKAFLIEAGQYLSEMAPNERIVEFNIDRTGDIRGAIGPTGGPMSFYSTVQRLAGHHNMAATVIHNYAVVVIKSAEGDIRRTGNLEKATQTLLEIMNAGRLVCFLPASTGCPPEVMGTEDDGPLGKTLRLPGATPAVFSQRLVDLAPAVHMDKPMLWLINFEKRDADAVIPAIGRFLESYLALGKFDMAMRRAAAIPLRHGAEDMVAYDQPGWNPVLSDYEVTLQAVRATVTVNGPGYVQLAHPWYPGNEIRVNGTVVTPLRGSLNQIVLPLDKGRSVIEIYPVMTGVRRLTFWISGTAILLILVATALAIRTGDRTAP